MIGFELGLKINFHGVGGWLAVGGRVEQMGIRLTSASSGVGVEVGAELGNKSCFQGGEPQRDINEIFLT